MPTIKIIFGRNNLPFSWLIRIVTWSRWSHCGMIVGDEVIEARAFKGVVVTPLQEFIDRYNTHEIALLPVKDSVEEAMARAKSCIGMKYDYFAALGVLFRTGWNSTDKKDCSEFLATICRMFREDKVSRIAPEDIYRISIKC